jgi:uncharacterized protein
MEKRAILGDIHPVGQIIFTMGVIMFVALVVVIAGMALAIPFTNKGLMELLGGLDMQNPENLNLMKYLQIISHLGMFIIPSLVLAWFFGRRIKAYLFLDRIPNTTILILSSLIIFAAVPFINFILELNMQMHLPDQLSGLENWMRRAEQNAEEMTKAFLRVDSAGGLLFNLFMVAVIPAIGEELMFRGVLMRIFQRWTHSQHLAIWITAILFSAIHIQFFGFFPRMILGVLFGYLVMYTGSLWPAIIAHFVNNAAAVIAWYLFHQKITEGVFDEIGKGREGYIYAIISIVITVALLGWIRMKNRETDSPSHFSETES